MFDINGDVDRLYMKRDDGGRGLLSCWDVFQCTLVRLSYYMSHAESKVMQMCANLDNTKLFSVIKKAENFLSQLNLSTHPNLSERPLLVQARCASMLAKKQIN
jgi:hypothetical protein